MRYRVNGAACPLQATVDIPDDAVGIVVEIREGSLDGTFNFFTVTWLEPVE